MSRLTEIINEYRSLGIPDQIDYDKLYLYSIITHSTAVEGSTVTEIENRLMFDEGISPDKPLVEQLMNLDLKNAYEEAISIAGQHKDYSVELLCRLSGMVMKNTGADYNTPAGKFSSSSGELRLLNVTAGRGGKSYMSYQKVPQRLEDFCDWLNRQRKKVDVRTIDAIYELSFMAHYNLVYIHPWADDGVIIRTSQKTQAKSRVALICPNFLSQMGHEVGRRRKISYLRTEVGWECAAA